MPDLYGTELDDVISGSSSADVFDGLDGSDSFIIGPDGGFDAFSDTGLFGWDQILAGGTNIVIGLQSGFGAQSGVEEISANGFAGVAIAGGAGNDVFDFSTTVLTGIEKISGGVGSDTIIGSLRNDDIRGNNLSDSLYGNLGNDALYGGDRNDLDPVLDASHGRDGQDLLDGGQGNDLLAGGAEGDRLFGGDGNDLLQGGRAVDTLSGGAGSDTFLYVATTEAGDLLVDFEQGADRIDLSQIDARSNTFAKNESFSWEGQSGATKGYGLTFAHVDGNTVVSGDTNGKAGSEFTLTLAGTISLSGDDFVL